MGDFHLLRPIWLLSLVPVLLIWWGLWRGQDRIAAWQRMIDPHLLEHLIVGRAKRRRLRPVHLTLLLWIVCGAALAGPTWEREPSPFADDQAGLVVLMKLSGTMNATDVQPSRLERAKQKLRDLLELREGAATGLIAYSGSAHLVMPLTRDNRIINDMAAGLSPDLMPRDGDALGKALELAAKVLDRAGVPGSVVVIADAVSPTEAAAVETTAPSLPVQFLSVRPPGAPVDSGLNRAAGARRAPVTPLSTDPTDVNRIAQRARSEFRAAPAVGSGERWRDGGYFLLSFVVLIGLVWSRKGWFVT